SDLLQFGNRERIGPEKLQSSVPRRQWVRVRHNVRQLQRSCAISKWGHLHWHVTRRILDRAGIVWVCRGSGRSAAVCNTYPKFIGLSHHDWSRFRSGGPLQGGGICRISIRNRGCVVLRNTEWCSVWWSAPLL